MACLGELYGKGLAPYTCLVVILGPHKGSNDPRCVVYSARFGVLYGEANLRALLYSLVGHLGILWALGAISELLGAVLGSSSHRCLVYGLWSMMYGVPSGSTSAPSRWLSVAS